MGAHESEQILFFKDFSLIINIIESVFANRQNQFVRPFGKCKIGRCKCDVFNEIIVHIITFVMSMHVNCFYLYKIENVVLM